MRALTRLYRRVRNSIQRIRDAIWYRRKLRYSWTEAWCRAGDWQ